MSNIQASSNTERWILGRVVKVCGPKNRKLLVSPGQQTPKDSPTVRSPTDESSSAKTSLSPAPILNALRPKLDSSLTLSFIINTNGVTITTEHSKFHRTFLLTPKEATGRSNSRRSQSVKISKASCFLYTQSRKIFSSFISPTI